MPPIVKRPGDYQLATKLKRNSYIRPFPFFTNSIILYTIDLLYTKVIDGKLKRLLIKKFGPLSPATICKLDTATLNQLETWSEAILDCDSIEQLLR
ncbi:hypothetical protein TI04_09410 [Achromatium sp. WMS2]|nr:hypothetical protein TI04_09410 [Achromatium sp. WMS2]